MSDQQRADHRRPDHELDGARMLVAFVGEDEALDHVAGAAIELAQRNAARLVLYDRDAASAFSDPLPNQWGSHREREQYGDPLSEDHQDGIAVLLVASDGSTQLAAGRL